MNSFTRYVFGQLFVGMIVVTVALTCVIWLAQSLRFIELIVNRGITTGTFLYLTMLLLPNFLVLILPFALFAVVVFTYNRMVADRELVVMRAAGMNQMELARPALVLTGAVMLFGYVLNFYLLPESYRMFRELQWDIRYNASQLLLQEGTFNTVRDDVTIYVRKRAADGQLHGILAHLTKEKGKPRTIMAERGALIETDTGPRVIMFNGNQQVVDKATNSLSILYFDRHSLDLDTRSKQATIRYREPRERTFLELMNIKTDPTVQDHDLGKFVVELHKRITSPLSGLAYMLVGLAAMIHGSFSRRMQTRRIVIAVGVVIALQASTLGLENLCARNPALIPLLYLSLLVPAAISYFFLVRHPRRRPENPDDAMATPA